MAWNYVPAGEYTEAYWVNNDTPGYPLVSKTDPTKGFADKNAALESLYLPMAGGNTSQLQSLIASNPSEYSKYGITPENAASMVDSTFYDRLHNIDNDPIAKIMNPLIQGGIMAGVGAGIGNLAGLTSFGDGSWLNSLFGNPAVSVAEGGMPTQVGGWSWEDPATFTGNFNPSLDGSPLMPPASPMMPPAVPETADTLKSWGLQETSPGVWSQPAMPDISMNAADWLKYGLQSVGSGTASSALKNLLSGNGSSGDIFSALGGLAPSLLGMYASNQQTNALKDLAGKYAEYGAPYRQQLADITADPSKFYNSTAAQQGVNTVLNKLSIGGNPSGSPYKQQLAVDSLWNDYGRERDRLAGFGGLTNYNAAAPSLDAQAVNSQGNMYNALGAGLNDIFNPKTSLADLLKQGKLA